MYDLDVQLLEQLPPWYQNILDYQKLCSTEQEQFEALAAAITQVADNFFFQTMDAGAVSQWEQIFKIVPDAQLESLSFRRARLLNRVSTRPPFTLRFLYQKLDELIGPDKWTVSVDYPNYTLYVESSAEDQQYATEVLYTIGKMKPAHIVYRNRPYLQTDLQVAESIEAARRIFHYKLGAWGLGAAPFATEQPQGVIKMPSTPSIQSALLTGVADFISADVATARINGDTTISDLTKSVSDSVLTVTYTVTQSQTSAINQVELLDADGTVLTASTVYVPIESPVVMKHTIPVSEGVTTSGR